MVPRVTPLWLIRGRYVRQNVGGLEPAFDDG